MHAFTCWSAGECSDPHVLFLLNLHVQITLHSHELLNVIIQNAY